MSSIGPLTDRAQQIAACIYWGTVKIDYDASGNIEYYSMHHEEQADEGLTDWVVKKFTPSSDGITLIEVRTGSYTGRAALDWA